MARTFTLRFLLAGREDLICEVREAESNRLKSILAKDDAGYGFFWFDALDGRSYVLNLRHLQGIRYLWDVVPGPPDARVAEDYSLDIALVGKELLSDLPSEDPKDTYTLFWELEIGGAKTVTFLDGDGEPFTLVVQQIVYLSAPKEIVDEGRRQVQEEDGH